MGTYRAFKLAVSKCMCGNVCVFEESGAAFAIERGPTMQWLCGHSVWINGSVYFNVCVSVSHLAVSPSIYPSVSVEIAKINLNTGSNNMYVDYINSKGIYLTNSAKPNVPAITTETHIKTSHPSYQKQSLTCVTCLSFSHRPWVVMNHTKVHPTVCLL